MQENIVFAGSLRATLCKLFLHCAFTNPELIKGWIVKHLEIPEENVRVRYERNRTDDNGNEIARYFVLFVLDTEFVLKFDKKIEAPKEIEVPKVVNKPKKWWQREPDTMVVVEKVMPTDEPKFHWVLNAIDG